MKEFLYLDSDLLSSFNAQLNGGILIGIQTERLNQSVTNINDEKTVSEVQVGGKIGAGTSKAMSTLGLDISSETHGIYTNTAEGSTVDTSTSAGSRETLDLEPHDYLFNTFCRTAKMQNILKTKYNSNQINIGDYFEYEANFSYINFERIEALYTEEYQVRFLKDSTPECTFSSDDFEKIRNNIDFLKKMIPYDAFLCADNKLVLMNQKHLRGEAKAVGFKFGTGATIIGRVTKLANQEPFPNCPPVVKTLNKIQDYSLSLLFELGFTTQKISHIITPIAIYF